MPSTLGEAFSNIQHKDARYCNDLLLGRSRLPKDVYGENLQSAGNDCLEGDNEIHLKVWPKK